MAVSLPHLPSFITFMISQLAKIDSSSMAGLSYLRRQDLKSAKSLFTTLHFIFPHELLPALDILDRKLITQLVLVESCGTIQGTPGSCLPQLDGSSAAREQAKWETFYVQSASTISSSSKSNSRYRRVYNATSAYYEVRLDAWNCTCPAFAFSAFGEVPDLDRHQPGQEDEGQTGAGREGDWELWRFGGTVTRDGTGAPICKHILAAVLGKALPSFLGYGVERKEVIAAEAAGWGAG